MSTYLIYGKRTGLRVHNVPVFDKTFRALTYSGVRVNKLSDAGTYATKEDAQEKLNKPLTKKRIDAGLVVFEIRKAK